MFRGTDKYLFTSGETANGCEETIDNLPDKETPEHNDESNNIISDLEPQLRRLGNERSVT